MMWFCAGIIVLGACALVFSLARINRHEFNEWGE